MDPDVSAYWTRIISDAEADAQPRASLRPGRSLKPAPEPAIRPEPEVVPPAPSASVSIAALIDAAMGLRPDEGPVASADGQPGPGLGEETPAAVLGPDGKAPAADPSFSSRFVLREVLGYGGMSEVMLAHQRSLDRDVAIKLLKADRDAPEHLIGFREEALLTARLEHPNIVPVHDAGERYLVMKRIKGRTLDEMLHALQGDDRISRLVEVLLKVCDAVAFAHARGIIHRDIKAANIMVGEFGEVLLVDWGLAVAVQGDAAGRWQGPPLGTNRDRVCAGTPACMPPEVANARAEAIGLGTDVFLLGAVLYHILCGDMLFSGGSSLDAVLRAAENRFVPLLQRYPRAPRRLALLLDRVLAIDPHQRGTVGQLAEDLRAWLVFSGNELEARRAVQAGQQHLHEAMTCSRKQWDQAYHAYVAAVREFERAISLWPEFAEAREARRMTMWTFSRAALASGDIFLARMLVQGQSPPAGGVD